MRSVLMFACAELKTAMENPESSQVGINIAKGVPKTNWIGKMSNIRRKRASRYLPAFVISS